MRLDDLLSMMRNKMKPNIKQFYWKYNYAMRMASTNGTFWKPSRSQNMIEAGYDEFSATESYCEMKIVCCDWCHWFLGCAWIWRSWQECNLYSIRCEPFCWRIWWVFWFFKSYWSDPTIDDYFRKQVLIPGRHSPAILNIEDTYGYEGTLLINHLMVPEYSAMRDQCIRCGKGLLILYAITSRTSFEEVPQTIERILNVKDQPHQDIPIILVG